MGTDHNDPLGNRETGSRAALPIWIEYMREALAQKPYEYFDLPDDVVRIPIDPTTGAAVMEDTPGAVVALFKKDAAPGGGR